MDDKIYVLMTHTKCPGYGSHFITESKIIGLFSSRQLARNYVKDNGLDRKSDYEKISITSYILDGEVPVDYEQ